MHELGKGLFVEHLPRLARVGLDEARIDLAIHRADIGRGAGGRGSAEHHVGGRRAQSRAARRRVLAGIRRPGRNQGSQASAETTFSA